MVAVATKRNLLFNYIGDIDPVIPNQSRKSIGGICTTNL